MFGKVFTIMMIKTIVKDYIMLTIKRGCQDNRKSVIQDKLGVSTIDEFMKMDIKDFHKS